MDMMRECNGQVFWNTLVGIKRPPVDLTSSQITLSCGDRYAGASLMVAAGADSGRQEVLVRLLDGDNQVLVNAILDGKLQYLRGSSFGVPADDVASATTLSMFGG